MAQRLRGGRGKPGISIVLPQSEQKNWSQLGAITTSVVSATVAIIALLYTARTFSLSEQSQITERYARAIEQLGADKVDVRVGAIYSLERLMSDSPKDRRSITDVLAAYVRNTSPRKTPIKEQTSPDCQSEYDNAPPVYASEVDPAAIPKADIQAAVTVLGRRPQNKEGASRIDLRAANLTGIDMIGAKFPGTDLTGAVLSQANFSRADFRDAHLAYADLSAAHFFDADFTNADLEGADISDANLYGANLTGTNLSASIAKRAQFTYLTDLEHIYLTRSGVQIDREETRPLRMTGTALSGSDLTDAYLVGADLTQLASLGGGMLIRTNLNGTKMSGLFLANTVICRASLVRADLTRADLSRTDLTRAVLVGADLSGALLEEADLRKANLASVQLRDAKLPRADITGTEFALSAGPIDLSKLPIGMSLDRKTYSDPTDSEKQIKIVPTDLSGADLSSVRGATVDQFRRTKRDSATRLPVIMK